MLQLVSNVPRPPGAWLAVVTTEIFISPWVYMEVLADADKARIVVIAILDITHQLETSYTSLHTVVLQ